MNSQEQIHLIQEIKRKFEQSDPLAEPVKHTNGDKAASVLVPLTFHNRELVVLYTHRSNNISRHRGQVSFPGGMEELGDITYLDTALRETAEEIGVPPQQVEVFGKLQPMDSPSGYLIHPYVGFIMELNDLHKNSAEVEKIFCIPLKWLLKRGNLRQEDYRSPLGEIHKVWVFKEFDGERVWGITAEITRRLLEKIK
jgi:8-oxo-dGTP pyrophosphatase MutT (NUDIX family)